MRAIMLAILCLCAYSAIGEDADTAFCDTIDGTIAEFSNATTVLVNYDGASDYNDSLGSDYIVYRVPQPTKLPGATDCTAYVYGSSVVRAAVFYTCRWTSGQPRSTFVDFGTQIDRCLTEQGYSRPWEGKTKLEGPLIAGVRTEDDGGHFAQFWRGGSAVDGYEVTLKAYKMSAKGVFLQMRFYDSDFRFLQREVRDWYSEHRSAIRHDDPYRYSEGNPFAIARPGAQKETEAYELWINAGENPGEIR